MPSIFRWIREAVGKQNRRRERALLIEDYQEVFRTQAGQRVLADILRRNRVIDDTFDPAPTVAAYHEGRRRAALEIVELINDDPDAAWRLAATGETEELFKA
jgi:hypothetical protein